MHTIDLIETARTGEREVQAKAPPASTAEPNPAGGPLAVPLLAVAVLGYQLAVTLLKVVNRERPALSPEPR